MSERQHSHLGLLEPRQARRFRAADAARLCTRAGSFLYGVFDYERRTGEREDPKRPWTRGDNPAVSMPGVLLHER